MCACSSRRSRRTSPIASCASHRRSLTAGARPQPHAARRAVRDGGARHAPQLDGPHLRECHPRPAHVTRPERVSGARPQEPSSTTGRHSRCRPRPSGPPPGASYRSREGDRSRSQDSRVSTALILRTCGCSMQQLGRSYDLAAMAISTIVRKIRLIVAPARTHVALISRLIEASRGTFVPV